MIHEWMNERMDEWMNEWINEWMNETWKTQQISEHNELK